MNANVILFVAVSYGNIAGMQIENRRRLRTNWRCL